MATHAGGENGSGHAAEWRFARVAEEREGLDAGGGGRGYTSLRDIMSSPTAKANSPYEAPAGAGAGAAVAGDVHMIRHPLVKHAAYAYLQLTLSAREEARRGMLQRRRGGPLCRLFLGCLSFLGVLFGRQ